MACELHNTLTDRNGADRDNPLTVEAYLAAYTELLVRPELPRVIEDELVLRYLYRVGIDTMRTIIQAAQVDIAAYLSPDSPTS